MHTIGVAIGGKLKVCTCSSWLNVSKLVIIYVGSNAKLLKHHVFYFAVTGFTSMEEDPSLPAPAASKFKWSSLARVTSDSLDPQKVWYVLTKELCVGVRPLDFSFLFFSLV